ncbi:hypothetical protein [Roseateles violae]|uniref:4Fe-4S ferredoxin-type domain-containing protein n=1 Tax=Roseateles violae TaxID=3058042 RepID=A0ABT8DZN2_9BURK|nr:hypothetical protein [Pelomonas sp. PFR6]MDN3923005.1 hypothetical protein [Pelomonas sp. PFR6]
MATPPRVILIQPEAPLKPAPGQPCNGCGVCCLAEPCPVGIVVSLRRHGACRALRWSEDDGRYVCGLLHGQGQGLAARLRARLVARWIAAGVGCDSELEPQSGQATSRQQRRQG